MSEYVKYPKAPIAYDGWPILGASIVFTVACALIAQLYPNPAAMTVLISSGLAILGGAFTLFSAWFFRNPERAPASTDPMAVISGADGTVLKIEKVNDLRYGEPAEKISIFMSPLNVHVNRSPIRGVVEKAEYIPGKFFAANLDKASTDNERNLVIVKSDVGPRIGFLQIAGFIARRIVSHVKPGDRLECGQRYGLIRFGSRMEIFLPSGTQVLVTPGQKLAAGHTVVAMLKKAGA
jgi:phosphatidylserine decarboxylase